jgi:protein tyrosine kinase modulator
MDLFDDTSPSAPRRSLGEYLEIPLRRPWLVVLPFVVIVAGSFVATTVLPKKYRSSTFILVESEPAPATVGLRMGATQRGERRMQTIKQEILSQTRLEDVIKETNPYPELGTLSTAAMVEQMRASTDISVRGPDAFDVEFVHANPQKAAEVVNRIATLFIDETNQARAQQVQEAYSFLDTQVGEARRNLETKEEAVRRYKEAHMGSLPEQSTSSASTLQRLQQQAQAVGEDLRAASDRQLDLEKQLAEASSGAAVSDVESGPQKEINQLRSQLAALRMRYTDEHPDVQQLLARLKLLESSVPPESRSPSGANPLVTTLGLRVEKARREVAVLQDKKAELEQRIAVLQSRLDATPRVEQELTTITRDFGNLKENYLGLVNKKLDAEMAAKMDERWKGEHFRILDPARAPDRPFFPNPTLFVTAGVVLGLLVGLGAAVLAEILDHSFKNLAEVEAGLPYPVLAAVPHMKPLRRSRSPRARKPQREADRSVLRL